jgi:hypothetical protein
VPVRETASSTGLFEAVHKRHRERYRDTGKPSLLQCILVNPHRCFPNREILVSEREVQVNTNVNALPTVGLAAAITFLFPTGSLREPGSIIPEVMDDISEDQPTGPFLRPTIRRFRVAVASIMPFMRYVFISMTSNFALWSRVCVPDAPGSHSGVIRSKLSSK